MAVAEWLWENPILRRERARKPPPAGPLQAAGAWAGLLLLLAAYFGTAGWLSGPERDPWAARSSLLVASIGYLLLVSLVLPGSVGGLISGERERGTLQPLLLTGLRPSQMVAGKFLIALRPAAFLLAAFLPLLMMGAHAARLPAGYAALLLLILATAPVPVAAGALWLSGRFRRTRNSTILAYLLTALFYWATLGWAPGLLVGRESLWWYFSPAWQAALLLLAQPTPSPLARPLMPEWAWFLLFCLSAAGLSLWLLCRRLARLE